MAVDDSMAEDVRDMLEVTPGEWATEAYLAMATQANHVLEMMVSAKLLDVSHATRDDTVRQAMAEWKELRRKYRAALSVLKAVR